MPLQAAGFAPSTRDCCAHPATFTLERRRSDFERDARVTPFTGSCCCCCCCLHWIGAIAGGVVGMKMGWSAGERKLESPLPFEARKALTAGVAVGVVLTIAVPIAAGALLVAHYSDVVWGGLAVLAVAPSLVFLTIGLAPVLASYGTRRRMFAAFHEKIALSRAPNPALPQDGSLYRAALTVPSLSPADIAPFSLFCRHCWESLDGSSHLPACPACGVAVDRLAVKGPDFGVGIAWRVLFYSFGLSTAATVVAYLAMWLLAVLFSPVLFSH